jgi:hypothetical protein
MANGYTAADIARLETRLVAYLEAEAACLRNQEYRMPDRRQVTRADLAEIRKGIEDLRGELASASGKPIVRGRTRRGVLLG